LIYTCALDCSPQQAQSQSQAAQHIKCSAAVVVVAVALVELLSAYRAEAEAEATKSSAHTRQRHRVNKRKFSSPTTFVRGGCRARNTLSAYKSAINKSRETGEVRKS